MKLNEDVQLHAFDKRSKEIYCHNGWAAAKDYKPPKFDIVLCKDNRGRQQRGWWTGNHWDFGHKRIQEPVFWRREFEYLVENVR